MKLRDPDVTDLFAPSRPPSPPPRARASDPPTSRAAARSMVPAAEVLQGRILFALRHGGPGTAYDLAHRCIGLTHVQIGKRLPELEERGLIRKTDRTAPGEAGRRCVVWEVC